MKDVGGQCERNPCVERGAPHVGSVLELQAIFPTWLCQQFAIENCHV